MHIFWYEQHYNFNQTHFVYFLTTRRCYSHESFGRDYKIAEKNALENCKQQQQKNALLCINAVGVFFSRLLWLLLLLFECRSTFISVSDLSLSLVQTFQLFRTNVRELINKYSLFLVNQSTLSVNIELYINIQSHHWLADWLVGWLAGRRVHKQKSKPVRKSNNEKKNTRQPKHTGE